MSNFLVLFDGKEGTSNLMMLLDQFSGISIVHQVDGRGWEPFDWYLHQSLSIHTLMRCLDLVFTRGERAAAQLNKIYTRSSDRPLDHYDKSGDIGFKMRFAPPGERGFFSRLVAHHGPDWINKLRIDQRWYEYRLMSLLRKDQVVVLFAIRQDQFRWALSKYHGDGTGNDGHLQFEVASGNLKQSDIPPIHVDPVRFQQVIDGYRYILAEKLRLMHKMQKLGIKTSTVIYEEFLKDPYSFFHKLFRSIGREVSDAEIREVMEKGTPFKKIHSEDISEFVLNHREIESSFGACVIDFEEEFYKSKGKPSYRVGK